MKERSLLFLLILFCVSCNSEQHRIELRGKDHLKKESKSKTIDLATTAYASQNDYSDLSEYKSDKAENLGQLSKLRGPKKRGGNKKVQTEKRLNALTHQKNKPLYVIDGVPINSTRKVSTGKWSGTAYKKTVTISSIHIKSIKILRGKRAVELYGDQGKYGVILITTTDKEEQNNNYIKSSSDSGNSIENAASLGMKKLLKEQYDKREKKQ